MSSSARYSERAVVVSLPLASGWELAAAPHHRSPKELPSETPAQPPVGPWSSAVVPGTVALALDLPTDHSVDLDGQDWWYRNRVRVPEAWKGHARLEFDGLATLADIWINGCHVARSENMFVPLSVDLPAADPRGEHEILIRFEALLPELEKKRARPRWRTALVPHQNLRWIRTTLLGRIPGWTPPLPPVGPWREVRLVANALPGLDQVTMRARLVGDPLDSTGQIELSARCLGPHPETAWIEVEGYPAVRAALSPEGQITATVTCANVRRWWPHTHGEPVLYSVRVRLDYSEERIALTLGRLGFRSIVVRDAAAPAFEINGVVVFCRGVCWTPPDLRAPGATDKLATVLGRLCDAGANMIRVGGTMVYESEEFYRRCDQLGLLVWQDLMLANMDYPLDDADFLRALEGELEATLTRLAAHPSVTNYCGGSEIAQQAAMLGLPPDECSHHFFDETLPASVARIHPGTAVFPSSPCGGALPFSPDAGIAHYYGVGAYLRPLEDVKIAGVYFTTECLGFSNVPDRRALDRDFGGAIPTHHPRWKRGVPRDAGSGWDFEDVRDRYMQAAFHLDPVALRSEDMERYLEIARVVPAHLMERTFAEWRRPSNRCQGGLVWFGHDLVPGAGWGIFDHAGEPKSTYWALARAWQAQTVRLTDEGLSGLSCHIVNDRAESLSAVLELELYQRGRIRVAQVEHEVTIAAHGARTLNSSELLGRFYDVNYSYRFGPPQHDVVFARLVRPDGDMIAEDVYIVGALARPSQEPEVLEARATYVDEQTLEVSLKARVWLQWVHLEARNCLPNADYFHLAPERERKVTFRGAKPGERIRISALNLAGEITVRPAVPLQ